MAWMLLSAALLAPAPTPAARKTSLVAGGPAPATRLVAPFGIDFAADGSTYVVEMAKGERLRRIDADGRVLTLAGTGQKGDAGDDAGGLLAAFNGMHSLAVGADGTVYLADTWNNRIRTYDPRTGVVKAFAGTGGKGFAGDGGSADKAEFGGVFCVALDAGKRHLYVADLDNRRVRKIDIRSRAVTTVAGNGEKGVPKDGEKATTQPLVDPRAVAADKDGNVYVLERGGHALRVVDKEGRIRTVAGTGKAGRAGTGGDAKKAELNGPKHLCVDKDGSVLIADTENHRVVWYGPVSGKLDILAGTGAKGRGDPAGDPRQVALNQPHGVTVHPKTGAVYVADSSNDRVLKIER